VLIVFGGRVVGRAERQKPGEAPPSPEEPEKPDGKPTDHLALLRADYERRTRAELATLRLRSATAPPAAELALVDLVVLLEGCRAAVLSAQEHSAVCAFWRRLRPLPPEETRHCLARLRRRLGERLHLKVYLDALQEQVVRLRTAAKKPKPQQGGSPP